MRHVLRASLLAGASLLAALPAAAAPLASATWTQTIQGVDITVTNAGTTCTSTGANLVQQQVTCPTRQGLDPSGTATASSYSVSLTLPAFALTQFTSGGAILLRTQVGIAGGVQTITGGPSAAAANAGLAGMVTVNAAAHAAKGVNASLLTRAPTTLVKVPLSIGKAGTFTGYFYVLTRIHYLTVDFYGWTAHTIVFTGLTSKGAALPDVTAMGSRRYLAFPKESQIPRSHFVTGYFGSSAVTLVAPSKISIDGPSFQRRTASYSQLRLSYPADGLSQVHGTPEPGTVLLLAAGAAGLLLARRRPA